MDVNSHSTDQERALVPKRDISASAMLENLHLELLETPSSDGLLGWFANRSRRANAQKLADELWVQVQQAYQAHLLIKIQAVMQAEREALLDALEQKKVLQRMERDIETRLRLSRQYIEITQQASALGLSDDEIKTEIQRTLSQMLANIGTEISRMGGTNVIR